MAQVKQVTDCARPTFPRVIQDLDSGGLVSLRFLVDEKGKVSEVHVMNSSGIPLIDKTGKEGIQSCEFVPKMVDGYPTQQWLAVSYYFVPGKSEQVLNELRASAKGGNWHAAAQLARYYLEGRAYKLEWSQEDAFWLLEKAATRDAAAAYELGMVRKYQNSPSTALKAFLQSAEKGYAPAQYELGMLYADKKLPEYNEQEAVRWLLKAADNDQREAQETIYRRYLYGWGVAQDKAKALRWANAAALQRGVSTDLLHGMGHHHMQKQSGAYAPDKAAEYYRLAAVQGNYESMYALGMLLLAGAEGVPKDEDNAKAWLTRSAELGHAPAQNELGWQLMQAGQGAKAQPWLYKAARQGEAAAQYNLGYELAIRADADPARQPEGVTWLRRAALQQHAGAMALLGFAFSQGKGVAPDMAEALNWYEKAAAKGNADAIRRLGDIYEKGELGQAADAARAKQWREKLQQKQPGG